MHDIRLIRDDPQAFDADLARRGLEPLSAQILAADASVRALQTEIQAALARRNQASKLIGQAMAQGDKDKAEALKAEVAELKAVLPAKEDAEREQLAARRERGRHRDDERNERQRHEGERRRRARRALGVPGRPHAAALSNGRRISASAAMASSATPKNRHPAAAEP